MKLKTVTVFLAACFVKIIICDDSLEEFQDADFKSVDVSEESPTGGKLLSFTTTGAYEWLRSLGFVAYTDTIPGYYVTFPANKDKGAYFNTTSDVFPLVYTLTGAALVAYVSGYLLTQIPIIDGLRRSADDGDLGFGRTYDEFDDADSNFDYDVSAEYEYSYPDSFYSAASEPQGSFVRKKKKTAAERERKKTNMKRRTGVHFDEVLARKHREPGIFDSITSAVKSIFSPAVRRRDTILGLGFDSMMKRYDGYWKRRRSVAGKPNWELNSSHKQARSEDISGSPEERFIGPSLPQINKEPGSGFYKDRVDQVYDNYYDNQSQ